MATWNPTNPDANRHLALKGSPPCIELWPWHQWNSPGLTQLLKAAPCGSEDTMWALLRTQGSKQAGQTSFCPKVRVRRTSPKTLEINTGKNLPQIKREIVFMYLWTVLGSLWDSQEVFGTARYFISKINVLFMSRRVCLHVSVCAIYVRESAKARRKGHIPWNWSYTLWKAVPWRPGTELGSFARPSSSAPA